jgi:hypothetical protein
MTAGRPPILSLRQRILLGAECERRWRELQEKTAEEKRQQQPATQAIRSAQGRASLMMPVKSRRSAAGKALIEEIAADIDDALANRQPVQFLGVSSPRWGTNKRPWGQKNQIVAEMIEWCAQQFSVKAKPRLITECWADYRELCAAEPQPET